jgi:hypothetical protein
MDPNQCREHSSQNSASPAALGNRLLTRAALPIAEVRKIRGAPVGPHFKGVLAKSFYPGRDV